MADAGGMAVSRFTDYVMLEPIGDDQWRVRSVGWAWEIGELGSDVFVEIPHLFVTDLASTPRFLWWLWPPHGRHTQPAVLHDRLYRIVDHPYSRGECDAMFREAMVAMGVPRCRRAVMYAAVRVCGWRTWNSVRIPAPR